MKVRQLIEELKKYNGDMLVGARDNQACMFIVPADYIYIEAVSDFDHEKQERINIVKYLMIDYLPDDEGT